MSELFTGPPSREVLTPSNVRRVGRETIAKSGLIYAGSEPTQLQILEMLEPIVEGELNRHNRMRKPWTPVDFLPVDSEGRIIDRITDPEQVPLLSPEAQAAMITNLLTEDNLPSYHRVIAENFGLDGAWGTWTNQWTAEENSHAYVMRAGLDLTLAVNPYDLEVARMEQMKQGYDNDKDPLHTLAYVTFQELATRVSHRNTGAATKNDMFEKMLQRIAMDENLHMLFYRNLAGKALDIAPNQMMAAIRDELIGFEMPGANIAGFQIKALQIANAGIYDPKSHYEDVVMPVLKNWKIFSRDDFTGYGAAARDELAAFLTNMQVSIGKFEDRRDSGQLARTITALQRRENRSQ